MKGQSARIGSGGRKGSSAAKLEGSTSFRASSSFWRSSNGTDRPAGFGPGIGAVRVSKSPVGGVMKGSGPVQTRRGSCEGDGPRDHHHQGGRKAGTFGELT